MATVRLYLQLGTREQVVEMPGATLVYRAAQRCVEAVDLDPEQPGLRWTIGLTSDSPGFPDEDCIADYDGKKVWLRAWQA